MRQDIDAITYVAMNLRGRDGGAMPELDGIASLRAAEGGSSRSYVALDTYNQSVSDQTQTLRDPNGTFGDALPAVAYSLGSHAGSDGEASNASHGKGGPVGMGIREGETPALRSGRTQAIGSAVGVRRLTPRECERLQALPDDWTQLGDTPDSRRYSALGDAVTATVSEWIGRRLAA